MTTQLLTIINNLRNYFEFDTDSLIIDMTDLLDRYMIKYPKIHSAFVTANTSFEPTKYHGENLEEHFIASGIACKLYADQFYESNIDELSEISKQDFIDLAAILGVFHDIGKPFAATKISPKKTKVIYTGHAQLGSRIMEELLNHLSYDHKIAVLWAIDHHMCYCTHCNISVDKLNDLNFKHHSLNALQDDLSDNPEIRMLSIALLSVISFADVVARIDATTSANFKTTDEYSLNLFKKLISYKRGKKTFAPFIMLHMLGLSGSGKSHFANRIKNEFQHKYDITIVERDQALYHVFKTNYPNESIDSLTYGEIYDRVYNNESIRSHVQTRWVDELNHSLTHHTCSDESSKQKLIIIDTCQTLFTNAFAKTLSALDENARAAYVAAKMICYYTVPYHLFNNEYQTKKESYSDLPLDYGGFWPILLSERENQETKNVYEYGTGSYELLGIYLDKNMRDGETQTQSQYDDINELLTLKPDQKRIDTILNELLQQQLLQHQLLQQQNPNQIQDQTLETRHKPRYNEICDQFIKLMSNGSNTVNFMTGTNEYVNWRVEQESAFNKLIVFTYQDGMQQFNHVPTRDYRGEGVIYNVTNNKFYLVRPALPVFPEMTSIANDYRVLPYIAKHVDKIENIQKRALLIRDTLTEFKTPTAIYGTPKYDGSLFNLTFISNKCEEYNMIIDIIDNNTNTVPLSFPKTSYYMTADGIYIIGSKGTCFSKNPVNARIHGAIIGSYKTIDNFLEAVKQIIKLEVEVESYSYDNTIVTLHFEALDVCPTSELTVYYGYSACPLFGVTIYDKINDKKTFKLPIRTSEYVKLIKQTDILVTSIVTFTDFDQVVEHYNKCYDELLAGNSEIEPEGFVVHLFDSVNQKWYPIKYKFSLYYVAHKPDSIKNKEQAEQLLNDKTYEKVRDRLLKFRPKPSITEIIDSFDLINLLKTIISAQIQTLLQTQTLLQITRKDWAIFWKDEQNLLNINEALSDLCDQIKIYYPDIKEYDKKGFSLIMPLYEIELKTDEEIDRVVKRFFDC